MLDNSRLDKRYAVGSDHAWHGAAIGRLCLWKDGNLTPYVVDPYAPTSKNEAAYMQEVSCMDFGILTIQYILRETSQV